MDNASRDQNFVTTLLAVSSVDGVTPVTLYANPTTHRLLVDLAGGGSGTVQTISIATANGFAGTSDGNATAPTLTLTTSVTGVLYGNGTAISALTIGTGLSLVGTTLSTTGGGSGDVVGPASATDSAVALYDGATGKLLKDSATTIATTSTVNTLVKRDANVNVYANNFFGSLDSTVSASGTTVLTIASARTQTLTGALSQTYQLPVATTLPTSAIFTLNNNSSGSLIVTNAGASTLYTVPAGGSVNVFCTDNSTSNGVWDFHAEAPASVTWSSGVTGLIMNSVLTTSPSVGSGASSSTAPSFIPQRGASTTGFGGDGTNLYATISGTARLTVASTGITVPAVNKVTITAPATGSTLTILDGKTLTANNSLTLAGTDATVMTFPSTSATIARTDAANTFTGIQSMTSPAITTSITTPTASFTAFAGATTLLTIGGTGASASLFAPSTLDATSSITGAIRTSGGISAAKAANIGTTLTVGSTIELGAATDTTLSRVSAGVIAVEGVTVPTISSTSTFTNKRITKRTGTTTSSATPTINTDNVDEYYITAQTVDITSFTTNLSGTATQGQMLFISVIGTAARAITWGASFGNGPVALPTTTVTTTELSVLFKYDGSIWRCYASGSRA